jgi:hypothetical protein
MKSFLRSGRFVLRSLALLSMLSGATFAADITSPTDPITGSSTNFPGGEAPNRAIDNRIGAPASPTPSSSKYLNFDELNTGFDVSPSIFEPIRGISIITANDAPERDPTSFTIEGSNDGVTFFPVGSGSFPTTTSRFAIHQAGFDNSDVYSQYRVRFPTVANDVAANSMQVAEVQLLRALDLTVVGDAVSAVGGSTPAAEGVGNAFDGLTMTKYLNLGELNTGAIVAPSGGQPTIVTGIGLISANDAVERDPTSYILEGSLDGTTFSQISAGTIDPFLQRWATQEIVFPNDEAYTSYRLIFPTVNNPAAANSMQIAEIQLYGSVVPEPASVATAAIAIAMIGGIALRRRRRKT